MHLGQASLGSQCRVLEIDNANAEIQNRLYALGVFPGVTIEVLRFAPLGDPIQLKVGRTLISIRKSEAEVILIEMLSEEAA
ncbi:MAG: ferrous iron transport protein A [Cellvibrionaceae bacterium]